MALSAASTKIKDAKSSTRQVHRRQRDPPPQRPRQRRRLNVVNVEAPRVAPPAAAPPHDVTDDVFSLLFKRCEPRRDGVEAEV